MFQTDDSWYQITSVTSQGWARCSEQMTVSIELWVISVTSQGGVQ